MFLFHPVHVLEFLVQSWPQCSHKEKECIPSDQLISFYSAAQNYANQNIRVIRVGPKRTYAYTYTHIRVYSIRAYA